jgi:hypothetical protein
VESCGGGQVWEHVGWLVHCSSYRSVRGKFVEEYSVRVGCGMSLKMTSLFYSIARCFGSECGIYWSSSGYLWVMIGRWMLLLPFPKTTVCLYS